MLDQKVINWSPAVYLWIPSRVPLNTPTTDEPEIVDNDKLLAGSNTLPYTHVTWVDESLVKTWATSAGWNPPVPSVTIVRVSLTSNPWADADVNCTNFCNPVARVVSVVTVKVLVASNSISFLNDRETSSAIVTLVLTFIWVALNTSFTWTRPVIPVPVTYIASFNVPDKLSILIILVLLTEPFTSAVAIPPILSIEKVVVSLKAVWAVPVPPASVDIGSSSLVL